MILWIVLLAFPVQDSDKPALLKYEDLKVIAERNVFSPAKPKPKKPAPRKSAPKPPAKRAAPNPVVRGFVRFPEGYRVLVYDPANRKEVYFKIGEKVQGAEILKTDLEKAEIRVGEKEETIFVGSEIQRTDGSTVQGTAPGKKESVPTESKGRSPRLQKRLDEMKAKRNKKVELEEEPE